MKYIFLKTIKLYQKLISPILHSLRIDSGCRFYPTCSDYTYQVIRKYGLAKGLFRGIKRIIRCNPFNKGGHDPC